MRESGSSWLGLMFSFEHRGRCRGTNSDLEISGLPGERWKGALMTDGPMACGCESGACPFDWNR